MYENSLDSGRSLLAAEAVSIFDREAQKDDPLLDGLQLELERAAELQWAAGVNEALELVALLVTTRARARFSTGVN